MDILLIYPPYESLMGLRVDCFPIGLGYIATVLKENGYDVAIYSAERELKPEEPKYTSSSRAEAFGNYRRNLHNDNHKVWKGVREALRMHRPKIVGMTSYAPTHLAILQIAKMAKEICNSYVVIGGPYPTLLPEEACQHDYIDYVVSGEGEYTMIELVNHLLKKEGDIKEIKSITYKTDGRSISNLQRERIKNLDRHPIIDRELLLYKESYAAPPSFSIIASRGCPHRCAFCASVPIWGRKVVYRSTDSILNELEINHRTYKNKTFRFYDDTFISDIPRAMEFCNKFTERGLHKRLSWGCLSRINAVNANLLVALEKANCKSIALGVESGSERILKTLKKDITKDIVREKVKMVKRSKLSLHLYFMIGSPCETEKDIIETYNFIKELSPDTINLCTFTPYYGTELYDFCVSKGILPEKHDVSMYENVGHHNKYNYFCWEIPQRRYIELVDMMMKLTDEICGRVTGRKINTWMKDYRHHLAHPGQTLWKILQKSNSLVGK